MDTRTERTRDRIPAELLIQKLLAECEGSLPRTALEQVFGVSPIRPAFVSRYACARGERTVADALRRLPTAWRTFHSLPIGDDENIDHIIVGPAGIFVIETRHRTSRCSGDVENGAALVTQAIRSRVPWAPEAIPLIVIVNAEELTQTRDPASVEVRGSGAVVRWLRKHDPILTADAVDQIIEVLDDPGLWPSSAEVDRVDLATRYAELSHIHDQARLVSTLWKVAGAAAAVVAVIAAVAYIRF